MKQFDPEEEARKFLLNIPKPQIGNHLTKVFNATDTRLGYYTYTGPCHGSFSQNNQTIIATGFDPKEENAYINNRLWEYISNPEISPWKMIFQNRVELVRNPETESPLGVIFHKDVIDAVSFNFIKNFCIFLRGPQEKVDHFEIWYRLIEDYNMDFKDALYLCGFLVKDKVLGLYAIDNLNMSGHHWGLTDNGYFDWDTFYSGNVGQEKSIGYQKYNSFFMKYNSKDYKPFNNCTQSIKTESIKGKFSETKGFTLDNIVDAFYKWKEKYVKAKD